MIQPIEAHSGRKMMFVADRLEHLHAGTEKQMHNLNLALRELGWSTALTVLRDSELIQDQWEGEVRDLGIRKLSGPVAAWRAWRFGMTLRSEGFSIAHIFFNDATILLPFFLRLAGVKVIVARRDMGFWYTRGKLFALRVSRRFVDRVIANSNAVAQVVSEQEGFDLSSIAVVYNGVVAGGLINPTVISGGDRRMVGLVANIRPVKRVADAIRGFAEVAPRFPNIELEIIGSGDSNQFESLVEQLGVNGRVRFLGQRTDINRLLSKYAICLLTSESEGLSNAIIEYLLAGKPVICTNTGGNPELIKHGENGLLYDVGNISALAQCLSTLLESPKLRARMGSKAREMAAGMFTIDQMVAGHVSIYESLIDGAST